MSMRQRYTIGLLLGIVALAGALAPAAPQPEDPNKALAKEQLKLVDQALQDLDRLRLGGEASLTNSSFILWERRKVEALRATGAAKAEVVAALEVYVKRMKDQVRYVESVFAKDMVSRVEVHDAKYRALEAEMWLNQEKAR